MTVLQKGKVIELSPIFVAIIILFSILSTNKRWNSSSEYAEWTSIIWMGSMS